ncbi:retention module-containing protein, partial [Shewanella waksmanii]|uniref:retention module-containing protein n=1 Tax=Shewanella waksmanii TaxID=213783 RepID=UPI0037369CA7
MGVSIAKEDAVVTNLVGQLKAKDEQGNIRDLSIGDLIRTGEQLIFTTGTKFNLEYADGTRITEMSLAEPPLQTTTTPNTIPLPETGEQLATSPVAIDDEIAALQAQILAGDDPTAELPATAAGTAAGGSGNEGGSDYIALDRNADETIASSGYDTAGFTQPADTTLDEEIISELDPAAPSLTINNVTVSEQDLPQGSAPQPSAVTQNNNLFLTAEAGVFSLFINNVAVILDGNFVGPVTITTAFGSFTASSFDATTGELSYSYTLNSAAEHTATDQVLETLTVVLTDLVGNSDSGAVNITIVDDAPVGNDDNNQVTEDNQNSTSGNLLQNDTQGADSATVSQITNSIGQSLAVNGATEISGNFGTLVVEADGSYSYTLASQQQNVQSLAQGEQLTESFSYQLLDADGDSVTVNLSILITGSNDAPQITLTFDGADEGTVIESGNLDDGSFVAGTATVNGALTGSDVDNGAVITWSGSATGSYGNFNIDANSGQWSYSLDNQLADSLAEGQSVTEQFLVTLTDEFGATDTQLITITVLGTNDSPVITSSTQDAQGTVVEAGNLDDGTFVPGTPSTGGVLTASDVDDGASLSWSGSAVGNFGSFTVEAATGIWSYTLDNQAADSLAEGEVVQEQFLVTVIDEFGATATQLVTVTIEGTNDSPVITSTAQDATGTVTESGVDEQGNPTGIATATGLLTASDVDNNAFLTWSGNATGDYGSFSIDALTGEWVYNLDNDLVDELALGETRIEQFLVTVTDEFGATDTQLVTITIEGTNDIPSLTVDAVGSVTEDATDPNLSDSGALSFTDVDVINTHSVTESYNSDISWSGGDLTSVLSAAQIQSLIDGFSVDSDSWDYSILNSLVQFLAEDESINLSFDVSVTDNNGISDTKTVAITINGTNDLPVLTVDAVGGVTEDATDPNLSDSGALSFTDVDVNNTHSVTESYNSDISWSGGDLTSVLSAAQIQSLIDGFSVDNDSWDYSILNSVVQFLALGESINLSFDVTVTDNDGGSDTKTVAITISGTNDLPVLTVDAAGGVTEDATNPNLTDSGALSFTDVDVNNTHSVSEVYNSDISWSGGDITSVLSAAQIQSLIDGFSVDSDSWDYSILNSVVQFLALGETITLSFDVTVTDNDGGSDTKTVAITINGTNDQPVLSVDAAGGVTEDATDPNLSDSGALSFTDVDVNNTHSVSEVYNSDISWSGGDITSVLSAAQIQSLIDGFSVDSDSWDYSILNSVVQFLALGESINLSFDVTVTDNDGGSDTKTVAITINGTNDDPVLSVDMVGGVTEDATDPNLTDSGALSFTDVDVNNTHSVTESYNSDISWSGGDLTSVLSAAQIQSLIDGFSVDNDSWDYSILNSVVQFLALGESINLSFDVTVTDNDGGSDTKTVAITINGTNDLPVLSVDMVGGVTEDATNPNLTDSGALSFTDVDVNNTHSVTESYNSDISWSGGD